jgi:hypothetical protein
METIIPSINVVRLLDTKEITAEDMIKNIQIKTKKL